MSFLFLGFCWWSRGTLSLGDTSKEKGLASCYSVSELAVFTLAFESQVVFINKNNRFQLKLPLQQQESQRLGTESPAGLQPEQAGPGQRSRPVNYGVSLKWHTEIGDSSLLRTSIRPPIIAPTFAKIVTHYRNWHTAPVDKTQSLQKQREQLYSQMLQISNALMLIKHSGPQLDKQLIPIGGSEPYCK